MEPAALVDLFEDVAAAIRAGLDELADWGRADGHDGQYQHDVVADEIAVPMLHAAGLGVVSEESPTRDADRPIAAVIDPIDGSTNASIGLPWFATSICAVDVTAPNPVRTPQASNEADGRGIVSGTATTWCASWSWLGR